MVVAELVDLVLPRRCVGCGAPATAWCAQCRPDGPPVPVEAVPGVPVHARAAYEGALRAAVLAFKERGRRELAGPLGGALAEVVAGLAVPGALLVAVPSARAAAAARGGAHVERLARAVGARLGLRVAPGALRLHRPVRDSAGLSIGERSANLAGAFRAASAPTPHPVVVLDDVVTTGATLREAVRALRAAGWHVRGAAVLAATPRRFPRAAAPRRRLLPDSPTGGTQARGLA